MLHERLQGKHQVCIATINGTDSLRPRTHELRCYKKKTNNEVETKEGETEKQVINLVRYRGLELIIPFDVVVFVKIRVRSEQHEELLYEQLFVPMAADEVIILG